MAGSQLPLSLIINISVATPQQGVGTFNTSNVAIFSREPYATTFGSLGYNFYYSPTQVGIDFGTSSVTYAESVALFSQQPNILANGGYLVIIPYLAAAQNQQVAISFPGVAVSGSWIVV